MAVLQNGILGGFSGNISLVNGYSCYSKDCIRNRVPVQKITQSEKQLIIQSNFRLCNNFFLSLNHSILISNFAEKMKTMSLRFAFFYYNLRFFHTEPPTNYSEIIFSRGRLKKMHNLDTIIDTSSKAILLRWPDNSFKNAIRADDQVQLIIHNSMQNISVFISAELFRNSLSYVYYMPQSWEFSDILFAYGYLSDSHRNIVSDNSFSAIPIS